MVVEGVLNIDKPQGMTSHDVVNRVRRVAGTRRVGHAGTLDPLATGVLLVCVGRATRLVEYLVGQHKVYEATIRLGQTTNTYDADGEVTLERPLGEITDASLMNAMSQFRGVIQQMPPMYSAIKKGGQPLYKLARKGVEVDRPTRTVTIHQFDLLEASLPDIRVSVSCSSGTYIRSLAHDLGETLGCGGHILTLRRAAIGDFAVTDAIPLADLDAKKLQEALQPTDTAVIHLPRVDVSAAEEDSLLQGQRVMQQDNQIAAETVRAYDPDGRFLGILIAAADHQWQPHKMFHLFEGD